MTEKQVNVTLGQLAMDHRIGFIGAGQMATAIITGLIRGGVVKASQIYATDTEQKQLTNLEKYGIGSSQFRVNANGWLVSQCNILVLSVKPQLVEPICSKEIAPLLLPPSDPLIISIAAGVSASKIEKWLSSAGARIPRVVRVMPNLAAMVGASTSVYYLGSACVDNDSSIVESIFGSIGLIYRLDKENQMDGATGVSGSGPAYIAIMIEALADAGVESGLTRELSQALAIQTVLGTALYLKNSGVHPGQLKDRVAGPAGTTIFALHELETNGFRGSIYKAVKAATKRSRQLSKL